jgi:hypothetical protein
MPQAAKITISEFDQSFNVARLLKGIIGVQGVTKRGPINGASTLMTSWPQFQKLYGGLMTTTDFPLYCKLMLDAGVKLRVKRCVDMATVVKAQLPVIPTTAIRGIGDAGNQPLFDLPIKYHGADYNNVSVIIATASNGSANYFNLQITHALEPSLNELYENLQIVGKPTIENSTYLQTVANSSQLVDVTYRDLSALSGTNLRPSNGTRAFSGGANGDAVNAADYTGVSSEGSGWFGFDGITDTITISAPEITLVSGGDATNAILVGANAYINTRKNMSFITAWDNAITTAANLVSARQALTINNARIHGYAGGVKWQDPETNLIKNLNGIAQICINMIKSDMDFGEWYSYAGLRRGILSGVLGPVNNFSNTADLDLLANAGINCIITKNNQTVIWGNHTMQLADSKLSQISVVRFLNKLKVELAPVLELYLEEPNEPTTWKALYNEVKPLLDDYTSVGKRALNQYSYQGDQNVKSISDIVVNTLPDINLGKYKIKLYLDIINAIREIGLEIYVTPSGVTFEEA